MRNFCSRIFCSNWNICRKISILVVSLGKKTNGIYYGTFRHFFGQKGTILFAPARENIFLRVFFSVFFLELFPSFVFQNFSQINFKIDKSRLYRMSYCPAFPTKWLPQNRRDKSDFNKCFQFDILCTVSPEHLNKLLFPLLTN